MQAVLDKNFIPAAVWCEDFLKIAKKPFHIALERENGFIYRYDTFVSDEAERNNFYIERIVKTLLWLVGGYKVTLSGDEEVFKYIKNCYKEDGLRRFDWRYMAHCYEKPFAVEYVQPEDMPKEKNSSYSIGRHLDGNRIGFDAGGSDMKVTAVKDGEVIFSTEVVWLPKENDDPSYHYANIKSAVQQGLDALGGKADALGVSSAGVFVDNRTRAASLFIKIPNNMTDPQITDIYLNIAKDFALPVVVANDGDVAALAGSISLGKNRVLGIAMGTSEAGGYVDKNGNITGWLNELAFVPCDFNKDAMKDEWSEDFGVGCKYFSQDAVIKLAAVADITFAEGLTPAQKLKHVQKLLDEGDNGATQIFETIGVYFGYAIVYYSFFYDIDYIQLLGRTSSGKGGDIIVEKAREVLNTEYSELAEKITIFIPSEHERRVGQSIAAASLPEIIS